MICKSCDCPIEKMQIGWFHRSVMDAVRCAKNGGKIDARPKEE